MTTTPDHLRVQDVVVDLVNSAPHGDHPERIRNLDDLAELMRVWIVTETDRPSQTDIQELHRFRSRLRAVFIAPEIATKITVVNELLATADLHPQLVEHDELGLHIHYFLPYASLADHLRADCSMTLALMFESGEGSRLKVCAAPDCGTVFIDRSKNRSRLYCDSQACGNRVHVAAYRARSNADRT